MSLGHEEINAEAQGRGDAKIIDKNLIQRRLGLVLNFGQPLLKEGISRVVNNL